MEWLYIVGLIGYYLYKAYSKGIENASDKNKPKKPIEPIGERKKEKTLDEILKELVDNANKQQTPKPETKKTPDVKVLEEKKKEIKEVQKNKPIVKDNPLPKKDKSKDNVLHKHKDFQSSIEYDDRIEKILHGNIDSIEEGASEANSKLGKEIGDHVAKTYQEKMIKVKGKSMSPKDLVIAQIIFERKYA